MILYLTDFLNVFERLLKKIKRGLDYYRTNSPN
jgi:hypothetical protein